MFTSFRPNECKVSEKRNWPPNIKLSQGSLSMSSELCKLPDPPSYPHIFEGRCPKKDALRCVESALSSFNDQSPSKQGPKYELVGALDCIKDSKRGVYHCNFIARLQNEKEAQDKLFFAELVYNEGPVLLCPLCCILGPKGTETGQYGCKSCRRHSSLIQHPKDKSSGSLMLSCEAGHRSGLCNLGLIFGKVDNSQSLEEMKFPRPESALTLSKHPHPDDGNGCISKLPCSSSLPTSFGRCREDTILENAKSALSSFNEQNISKKTPSFGGMFCTFEFCIHPGSFGGSCPPWLAEAALPSFNEQILSKQGPEYELVDVLDFTVHRRRRIYHCNFIARLKNESKAEDKLFFAELEFCGTLRCNLCCILGPIGTVTGENGCMSCLRRPGLVHHPEDGFSKVFQDVRADAGRSVVSGEADNRSGLGSSEKISGMVNTSHYREVSKCPLPESASTLSNRPCSSSLPTSFGRCREDTILENANSAISSFNEQNISKKTPSFGGMFCTFEFSIHPGSFGGSCPPWLAEAALPSFNEQSLSKQGPEYELVDVLDFTVHRRRRIYHCNFIARLKNETKAEDKLFFAELEFCGTLRCNLCCILGPIGTVTGENGCMSCLRRPGLVHHPEDGFLKVFEDVRADAGCSMLSCEADHPSGLGSSEKISGMKVEDKASSVV